MKMLTFSKSVKALRMWMMDKKLPKRRIIKNKTNVANKRKI